MVHFLSVFVLPLISLLAGVASLYIDPRSEPRKKWILVGLMLLSAAGAVMGGYKDDQEKADSAKQRKQLDDTIQNLSEKTDTISVRTGTILDRLSSLGLSPATAGLIQRSISADAARTAILPILKNESASDVTVAYYPKDVDGPVVINALKEGGFKVETRTGNPANASLKTNAIWVGDSVTTDETKFVALTLVRAGVGIVSVRRGFHNNPEAKKFLIEVGTDHSLLGTQPLTVEQISAMAQIPAGIANGNDLSN